MDLKYMIIELVRFGKSEGRDMLIKFFGSKHPEDKLVRAYQALDLWLS